MAKVELRYASFAQELGHGVVEHTLNERPSAILFQKLVGLTARASLIGRVVIFSFVGPLRGRVLLGVSGTNWGAKLFSHRLKKPA